MARRKKAQQKRPEPTPARHSHVLRIGVALAAAVAAVGIGVTAAVLALGGGGESGQSGARTAVIVDQLSLTQPNPEFVSAARDILSRAGYTVDYFPGEQVTVDLYRRLPEHGYDVVLLRVHAGITREISAESGAKQETEYVSLFTGEKYEENKYPAEQLNRLGRATYYEGAEPLFGIGPAFVSDSMEGDFDGALIVMMGCDGLRSQRTAEAFLDRGASAFVSWSKPVSAPHTDAATQRLLERVLLEGQDVEQAVQATAAEVGPDPAYEAELRVLTSGG